MNKDLVDKVPVCHNHLADFYEALKRNDLKAVRKIEHELTPEEECVACSYIFITKGDAKEALEKFLIQEGFCINN